MPHELFAEDVPPVALAITHDLPRDQALGLRLIALAKAAAGMHMAQFALGINDPTRTTNSDSRASSDADAHLLRSQAAALFDQAREEAR